MVPRDSTSAHLGCSCCALKVTASSKLDAECALHSRVSGPVGLFFVFIGVLVPTSVWTVSSVFSVCFPFPHNQLKGAALFIPLKALASKENHAIIPAYIRMWLEFKMEGGVPIWVITSWRDGGTGRAGPGRAGVVEVLEVGREEGGWEVSSSCRACNVVLGLTRAPRSKFHGSGGGGSSSWW